MSDIRYLVVVNVAAHDGHVAEVDLGEAWSNSNPNGWTQQEMTGSHGNVWDECKAYEEANKVLNEWLKCDSIEKDTYCYTHNPDGNTG